MVTISTIKRQTANTSDNSADYNFKGLSTDTKPTNNVAINSFFLELDTGKFYYFNGVDWELVVGSGGGGGGGGGDIPLPVSIANGGTSATTAPQARTNLGIYSKDETDALIPTDLNQLSNINTKYVNETQLNDALDALGRIFTLKGSVATANDLPATGNSIGDVYYVSSEDKSYVWITDNGVEKWYQLSGTINTENFLTKSGLLTTTGNATDNTMTQAAITTALNGKANTGDIPTDLSQLSNATTNYVNMSQVQAVIPTQLNQLSGTLPISKGGTGGTTATAARTNLGVYTKERLYNNSSGSSGTITLSATANNYNWLEIHYGWSTVFGSTIVIPNTSGSKTINLSLSYLTGSSNELIVRSTLIYLNGRTITWGRNHSVEFVIGGKSSVNNDKIVIHQVYGFKR